MGKSKPDAGRYTTVDQLDASLYKSIQTHAKNGELPCAVAFQIAAAENVAPAEIGRYADCMKVRLIKCQMGLFGYQPHKKIVQKKASVSEEMKTAVHSSVSGGKITCTDAWRIAGELGVPRLAVGNACESLSIKVHACQLGAF